MVGIQVILKLCMYLFVLLFYPVSFLSECIVFYICFTGFVFLDLLYKLVFLTAVPATLLKISNIKL